VRHHPALPPLTCTDSGQTTGVYSSSSKQQILTFLSPYNDTNTVRLGFLARSDVAEQQSHAEP